MIEYYNSSNCSGDVQSMIKYKAGCGGNATYSAGNNTILTIPTYRLLYF